MKTFIWIILIVIAFDFGFAFGCWWASRNNHEPLDYELEKPTHRPLFASVCKRCGRVFDCSETSDPALDVCHQCWDDLKANPDDEYFKEEIFKGEKMNAQELDKILTDHKKWLMNKVGGIRADLSCADLSGANLRDADLRGANLSCADLSGADLSCADLSGAYLRGADLRGAYLSGANLRDADLRGAYLSDIKTNTSTIFFESVCPEGDFFGFKKCRDNKIVKLLIPSDARRSNATSYKCRCDKALVIAIEDENGKPCNKAISQQDEKFIYEVGESVSVDNFDEDRWNECSTGIHFFISKNHAKQY